MNDGLTSLEVVLCHWPIVNKTGELVTTATTNLDIHDIARACTTYGVNRYWILQPLDTQRHMIERILHHWQKGHGSKIHRDRPEALARVHVAASMQEIADQVGENATWICTSAQPPAETIPVPEYAASVRDEPGPHMLCFGTGWGLAPQVIAASDGVLESISPTPYNHLSVRSAVSIYLDRIWMAAFPE